LLALVLKESARVNTIINDFLAYSRMPAATKSCFGAEEFRDQITLQIRQHVAAKGGRVDVYCDVEPVDLTIVADPGQLTQMTLNLAINACEAMAYQGELRIGLNLVADGETYELVATDNGPGIEPEIRDHLFSPFKTTKEGGTGLGLSIVARIASAHGGSVKAEDHPDRGAIFRVRWPVDQEFRDSNGSQSDQGDRAKQLETAAEPLFLG
jgi:signal transduction histidine kinase